MTTDIGLASADQSYQSWIYLVLIQSENADQTCITDISVENLTLRGLS